MDDQQPEAAEPITPEAPQVGFGEVAEETVEESVAHEREITSAGDRTSPGTEPYDPEAEVGTEAEADVPEPWG